MLSLFCPSRLARRILWTLFVIARAIVARLWQFPWHVARGRVIPSAARRPVRGGGW